MSVPVANTLVIGAKGFVGSHFYEFYKRHNPNTLGCHHTYSEEYHSLDLNEISLDFLSAHSFEYALLACGITKPKQCELDPKKSYFINVEQTLALARALLQKKIIPILFSSDYVFDGQKKSYDENSPTSPLNQYGKEKAELEKRAHAELSKYCMLRVSKIYGTNKGDGSIFDQMAVFFEQNKVVKAATDQVFCPVHIHELIQHVVHIQKEKKIGLFNCAGPEGSRYQYARALALAFGKEHLVYPILMDEMQDGVRRPKRVVLNSSFSFSSPFENIRQLVRQYQNATKE